MEWDAQGISMGILPCKLGCPLLPYMETVDSSVGRGSPLLLKWWAAQWVGHHFQIWKQWAAQWATH